MEYSGLQEYLALLPWLFAFQALESVERNINKLRPFSSIISLRKSFQNTLFVIMDDATMHKILE
jgi:hypothetical protein